MIFLDTSKIEEIKRFHRMGLIRGVTTNPTILYKEGVKDIDRTIIEIAELIQPYPLSIEVTRTERMPVIDQACHFFCLNNNNVVKITIHGPNGELENLELINYIENVVDIRVNVTAMMNAQQCLLAAYAGATYISIFGGRVNNMGYNVCKEIEKLRTILDREKLKSQIIVGSVREPLNVIEWLEAGAHIVTVTPSILESMIVHPYTKETVQMFLKDAEKLKENL